MQKHAIPVGTGLVSKIRRAILGGAELRSQDPVAVLGAVDCGYALRSILFPLVGHVDADGLRVRSVLGLTNDDLDNLAIPAEVLVGAKNLEQLVLLHMRSEAGHVDQILLHHAQTRKMLATQILRLGLLLLLLQGSLGLFLLLRLASLVGGGFLRGYRLVLDVGVVVRSSTSGAQAVHIVLDVVVAELTYLSHPTKLARWTSWSFFEGIHT